jgi:hypothetical protein
VLTNLDGLDQTVVIYRKGLCKDSIIVHHNLIPALALCCPRTRKQYLPAFRQDSSVDREERQGERSTTKRRTP